MSITLKYALLNVHVTTGILVPIRLHKKADLLETKLDSMKDRNVCADEIKF